MVELPPNLLLMDKSRAQIYAPGRYLIFTKSSKDLFVGYKPEDISFTHVLPPVLTSKMQEIWDARFEKYGLAKKRAGKFLGMQSASRTLGTLAIPFFESGFLDWKCTLPIGDEFDAQIEKASMRPPINIHHAPITVDDWLLYVTRGTNRESWSHAVLGTHSWGADIDKNYACAQIMQDLNAGQGGAVFRQARDGVRRELNPFKESGSPDIPNTVLDELLSPQDVTIKNASCLTLHIRPVDMGYHICFVAKVNKEAGDLLEQRNRYPMVGRISSYNATPFTADSMVKFFSEYKDRLATSIEATIVMACVQKFGEEFLAKLPYDVCVRGKRVN